MVSQCANPECRVPFLYFGQGKLVAVPRRAESVPQPRVKFFWLCPNCANHLDLEVTLDGAMNLVQRQPERELRSVYQQEGSYL